MKTKFYLGVLIVLAFLDDFIAVVYPFDFTYHSISFVPHFCFIGLMMIVCTRPILDRVLMSLLCGLLSDFFFMPTFPTYTILYTLLGTSIGFLQDWMEDNDIVKGVSIFGSVVLLEFIPFFIDKIFKITRLKYKTWFIYNGLLTFSLNTLMIFALIYIFSVFERYEAIQKIRKQRVERNKYRNLRLTRK